ncbi:MAG: ABC transporter ATP-binding protein [Candidatus Omnitrophica bacterium]|nr:ABC transporter ATP-binding protein [Candidatus Omnitrophota bacterium]
METFAIELKKFSYSFGNGYVLDSLAFKIKAGEYVSVVGPNGSGKTTLLKNIVGILKGSGSINVLGRDIVHYSRRDLAKNIAYVPQSDGRSYPFQVREFILMSKYPYLNPFSRYGSRYELEVERALESVHMTGFKTRFMNMLSSGERQKIMICASLVQNAKILLLDEPTTFLDPKHEEEINSILKKYNREKKITIFAVSHNINSAVLLSDRILSLKNGRVVYCGEARGFTEQSVLRSVYEKEFKLFDHPEKGVKMVLPEAVD